MNYEEATKLSLIVPWKTVKCTQDDCWCFLIEPKDKIECVEDEHIYIIGAGAVHREAAVHIVKVHNESLGVKDAD